MTKEEVQGLYNKRLTVIFDDQGGRIYKCKKRGKKMRFIDPGPVTESTMDIEISMICKYCREEVSLDKENK